jgi:hypothetical protein
MWRIICCCFLILSTFASIAQNTRNPDAPAPAQPKEKNDKKGGHKVVIIPFEPKMYLSEVDKKIGESTKMNFNQVRSLFRNGLDKKINEAIARQYSVFSLLADSAKTAKEITQLYSAISYSYMPIPGQTVKENGKKSPVKNGHLETEGSGVRKFMNTQLSNNQVLTSLSKKYNADVFLFINELDIKNDPDSYDAVKDVYEREVCVHYTAFDINGKQLCGSMATIRFPSSINDPSKIIATQFALIAKNIALDLSKSLAPPAGAKNKTTSSEQAK